MTNRPPSPLSSGRSSKDQVEATPWAELEEAKPAPTITTLAAFTVLARLPQTTR